MIFNNKMIVLFTCLMLPLSVSVMVKAAEEKQKKEIDLLIYKEMLRHDCALLENAYIGASTPQDKKIEKMLKGTEQTIAKMKKKKLDVGDLELQLARARMANHIAGVEDYRVYERYFERASKHLEAEIARKERDVSAIKADRVRVNVQVPTVLRKQEVRFAPEEPVKIIKTRSSDTIMFCTAFRGFLWDKISELTETSLPEEKQLARRNFYADLIARSAHPTFFKAHGGAGIGGLLSNAGWTIGAGLPKEVRSKFDAIVRTLARKEAPGIL